MAENSDTRQGINRHDPDAEGRKKKKDQGKDQEIGLWEDSMEVSIPALQEFLKTFLGRSPQKEKEIKDVPEISEQPEKREARNTQTKRAIQAYETQSHYSDPPAIPEKISEKPQNIEDPLSSSETRLVHQAIEGLNTLSNKGYTTLSIEKDGSFLESIVGAIQKTLKA